MKILKIDASVKHKLTVYFDRTFLPASYGYEYRKRVTINWEAIFNRRRRYFMFDAGFNPRLPNVRQALYLWFFIIEYENYG